MKPSPPQSVMHRIAAYIQPRRLLLALPVLAALAAVLYVVLDREDATATTPVAALLDTATVNGAGVGVRQERTARDFSAAAPDGTRVRLSGLRGQTVVINFWATWCTSCLAEMPDLKAVQEGFGSDEVHVLAVNSGESFADAADFIESLDASAFTYVFDPSLAVTDAYGVVGLSHTVFVDAEGVIRATYTGQLTPELMREYVADAMASTTSAEAPFRLRLPGTVEARSSVLRVEVPALGEVRISGRRLRCDDSYCSDAALDLLATQSGVSSIGRAVADDQPTVVVGYEPEATNASMVVETLAALLEAEGDPLYQHPITIEYE